MKTLEHSIEIPAPVDEVWAVLTAGDEYAAWNPFMTQLNGQLAVGERLAVTICPGTRTMTFKPTVVALEPGRLVRWQGRLGIRGVFDGEHELRLEPTPLGTRFTQHETFSGVLVPFLRGVLADTLRGFAAMNQALSDRTLTRSSETSIGNPASLTASASSPGAGPVAAQEGSRR